MFEMGTIADWVAAGAGVIAAFASVWLMLHTLKAGRLAKRDALEARLFVRVSREAANALKISVAWEPDELGQMVLLDLRLADDAPTWLQTTSERYAKDEEKPWNGNYPVLPISADASRQITVPLRHWLNSRSESWSTTLWLVSSEEQQLERSRAKLRILAEDSRKVLMAKTIAISPMD